MNRNSGRIGFFFTVMFVFNMAANFVHPVTPALIVDLQLSDYMFGLALAAMSATNFLFSPLWGKLAGRMSSKTIMFICAMGYAVGQVFFGIAQTELQFLLARMFAGVFVGGCYTAFLTYTVNCSQEKTRGRNLALNATVTSVSSSFGYFIGGMVGEINIYYSVWLQVATLAGTGVLFMLGCRDDRQTGLAALSRRTLWRECNPLSAFSQCRHFLTPVMVSLFLVMGLNTLGYIAFEQCFNFFLRDQFGLTSGYNGVIKAALGLISLVSNCTLCMWILRRHSITPWIAGVMGVCTVTMIGAIFFDAMIPFIVVNVLFFAFNFISSPLMQQRAASLGAGENSNLVMGAVNAVKSFGQIFGAALAGFLYELMPKAPFVFGFAAFALATLIAVWMVRLEKHA